MDSSLLQSLNSLLTLPFIIFCVMIMLLTKLFSKIIEALAVKIAIILPDKWEPWWVWLWKEVVLPVTPLVFGGLLGYLIADYPYPDQFSQSLTSRVFIGITGGIAAAWLYPRFMFYYNKFFKKKLEQKVDEINEKIEEVNDKIEDFNKEDK